MKKYVFISILVVGVLAAAYFLLFKEDEADASTILGSLLNQNGNIVEPPKIEDFLPQEEVLTLDYSSGECDNSYEPSGKYEVVYPTNMAAQCRFERRMNEQDNRPKGRIYSEILGKEIIYNDPVHYIFGRGNVNPILLDSGMSNRKICEAVGGKYIANHKGKYGERCEHRSRHSISLDECNARGGSYSLKNMSCAKNDLQLNP